MDVCRTCLCVSYKAPKTNKERFVTEPGHNLSFSSWLCLALCLPPIWATCRASNNSCSSCNSQRYRATSRRTTIIRPVPAPWRHCVALCWDTCSASSRRTGRGNALWRKCSSQGQACLIASPLWRRPSAWTSMRCPRIRPRQRTMR